MKFFFRAIKIALVLCFTFYLFYDSCSADPAALYFDPGATHEVWGVNRYPTEEENWKFDLHLSPFYQHATGARDKNGHKVKIGDRLGTWDMFPMMWGNTDAAPEAVPFNETSYPNFYFLKNDAEVTRSITEDNFAIKGELGEDGTFTVGVDYEKVGFRFELDLSMAGGFGLTIKSGAVDLRQTPTFYEMTRSDGVDDALDNYLDMLMTPSVRDAMLAEVGLNLDRYQTTVFEDTFAQLYWSNRFKLNDKEDHHVVTVAPYVGAGIWIPTGKKKDIGRAFSMPTGHDGFWGVTLEGAINFDFPGTVVVNIGGAMTVFETKNQIRRVPNHVLQSGVYPWVAKVRRRFGTAWNCSFSLMSNDILDNLSVFFDYIYARHEKDSITMKEDSASRNDLFYPGRLEDDSLWKAQVVQLGFNYQVSPNLGIGFAGQTHISGMRVYKTHTVMGTITFTF